MVKENKKPVLNLCLLTQSNRKRSSTLKASNKIVDDEQIKGLLEHSSTLEAGFRLLMESYQERLYWHIRRIVTEHEDANDVLQNALIKVFNSIERFKWEAKLYTWLYRIATNEAITFLNKKRKKLATSIDSKELNLSNKLQADSYFDGNEAQRQLQLALQTLPEKQRLVFNMRYFDELSYHDISNILGTSEGGLKASYHHAAKKIERFIRQAANL